MTGNQALALSMPLIAAVAIGLVGLFVRRPWSETPIDATEEALRNRIRDNSVRISDGIEMIVREYPVAEREPVFPESVQAYEVDPETTRLKVKGEAAKGMAGELLAVATLKEARRLITQAETQMIAERALSK